MLWKLPPTIIFCFHHFWLPTLRWPQLGSALSLGPLFSCSSLTFLITGSLLSTVLLIQKYTRVNWSDVETKWMIQKYQSCMLLSLYFCLINVHKLSHHINDFFFLRLHGWCYLSSICSFWRGLHLQLRNWKPKELISQYGISQKITLQIFEMAR